MSYKQKNIYLGFWAYLFSMCDLYRSVIELGKYSTHGCVSKHSKPRVRSSGHPRHPQSEERGYRTWKAPGLSVIGVGPPRRHIARCMTHAIPKLAPTAVLGPRLSSIPFPSNALRRSASHCFLSLAVHNVQLTFTGIPSVLGSRAHRRCILPISYVPHVRQNQ